MGVFRELDDLLRGRKTSIDSIENFELSLTRFVPLAIALGAVYGFFVGWYAVLRGGTEAYMQLFASTVKLPLLFLITLAVTFPSLYVFSALMGSRLSFAQTLRLLIAAVVVNLTIAAALGPILGFFTISTTSYSFMVVLNIVLLAISGAVALGFLLKALRFLASEVREVVLPQTDNADPDAPQTPVTFLDEDASARQIFRIWVIIYGLVGAQTGWLLRPFIGTPDMPFTWFRDRGGNFFTGAWESLQSLLGN